MKTLEDRLHAAGNGANATRERANRFAANVLPIMREIRDAGVATLDGIASALNARGVRAARGGAWHATAVRNLLAREAPLAKELASMLRPHRLIEKASHDLRRDIG